MKLVGENSANADSQFQQLDKLRIIYEEFVKLGKETIPLAEKNLNELTEELDQKSQALDDVSIFLAYKILQASNWGVHFTAAKEKKKNKKLNIKCVSC